MSPVMRGEYGEEFVPMGDPVPLEDMAYVEDAPADGSTYGRKDGAWEVAGGGPGGGLTQAQVLARAWA